jgi:hypothetical protein
MPFPYRIGTGRAVRGRQIGRLWMQAGSGRRGVLEQVGDDAGGHRRDELISIRRRLALTG